MHCMVHEEERHDQSEAEVIAALARSAWEDLQQQRRSLIAGRQMSKLDIREDDSRARLLSKEEEEKVAKGRAARAQQQFRATPDWRNTSQTGFASPTTTSRSPQTNKARARARATTAFEGAQTLHSSQQGLGSQSVGTLSEVLDRNALSSPTCPFMGQGRKFKSGSPWAPTTCCCKC